MNIIQQLSNLFNLILKLIASFLSAFSSGSDISGGVLPTESEQAPVARPSDGEVSPYVAQAAERARKQIRFVE